MAPELAPHDDDDAARDESRDGGNDEPLWTPPQFGLRAALIAMTGFAILCAVTKITWFNVVVAALLLALFFWFSNLCVRIVRLSNDRTDERR